MLSKNIETFIGCDSDYTDAELVIFGAPFDSTTSYRPGTRFGPSAIRHESFGLETYSPYQDKDLEDHAIMDSGDLELCFGSSEQALYSRTSRTNFAGWEDPAAFRRRTFGHIGQRACCRAKVSRSAHHSF